MYSSRCISLCGQPATILTGVQLEERKKEVNKREALEMDVYSYGILLYEMCIKELPEPKRRKQQVSAVSDKMFRGIIRRCIKRAPEERPTMEEIIVCLDPQ